jgi:hypothetical protein
VLPSNAQRANPVFVVGVFRSGTSLLYSLLNQHPQIALMYECDVWDFPGAFARRRFQGEWLERQEFYNQVLSRHRLIWGGRLSGLENVRTPDDLYRCHSGMKDAPVWGEKSPLYSTRIARLARQYPDASFLFLWRDPVEIYRSIRLAGGKSPFFRRPGMLHRLIYHQEKMIREAAQLPLAGGRVQHVCYDDLVDRTEPTCREICKFLEVPFDASMLALQRADFSAIYNAPHHDFLRRGVIERRKFSDATLTPEVTAKLRRFRNRWERLSGQRLGAARQPDGVTEPSLMERLTHHVIGAALFAGENAKRLAFEVLPLAWLRTYRLFKNWIFARNPAVKPLTLGEQFRQHGVTIFASLVMFAAVITLDYLTGPEVSMGPFYLVPCGALALVVGRTWGTLAALVCAVSITVFRDGMTHNFHSLLSAVVIWNLAMRFIFFETFVLLLSRIRAELQPASSADGAQS